MSYSIEGHNMSFSMWGSIGRLYLDVVHVGLQCLEDLRLGHAILLDTVILQNNVCLLSRSSNAMF